MRRSIVLKTGVLAAEGEFHLANRAVTLLADDNFGLAFVRRIRVIDFIAVDEQDQVDKQREELITQIESKLNQKAWAEQLFFLRWRLD